MINEAIMGKLSLSFFLAMLIAGASFGKKPSVERVDPPNWWVGMQHSQVELLIKGEELADVEKVSTDQAGIVISKLHRFPNSHYLGLTLNIDATAKPGTFEIFLEKEGKKYPFEFRLDKREVDPAKQTGLTPSDFIYLVFPDRFANGDPSNDKVSGMNEEEVNRDSMFYRHGGDLQGIKDHLSYFTDLGVTALWINPVQENDQPKESYHGYAITDHYKIDPRLGTNSLYKELVRECRENGLKMVMDVIYNHWGDRHYLQEDLPDPKWVHQWNTFTRTQYRAPTLMDPYAADIDKKRFTDGWFDHHMPDLDQTDPHLAAYLIQNTIWWIEYVGLEGLRIDTYAYPDQDFMQDLVAEVLKEYPNLGIFGETWVHGMGVQGWFTNNHGLHPDHHSNLPGVTDFQLYYALNDALNKKMGWTEGVARMYYTLAKDYIYTDPYKNVLFLDNHDLSRFYSVIGEDIDKFKMGLVWLMTMRGIPQIYYGTEILMKNFANPDGKVREDFPGGWKGDKFNKFEATGRTRGENEAYKFVQKLARWRKSKSAITSGKMTQFIPKDGLYVYIRHNDEGAVMVALNCSDQSNPLDMDRYTEILWPYTSGQDVMTGKKTLLTYEPELGPYQFMLLEFNKE